MTSEIVCGIPESAQEWKAETAQAWSEARKSSSIRTASFSGAYRSLFLAPDAQDTKPSSAIGNYALTFAILQCIYFRRQDQLTMSLERGNSDLRTGDI